MIRQLLLSLLLIHACTTLAAAKGKGRPAPASDIPGKKWLTLKGGEPVIVARGGFSGVAPESSLAAYGMAQQTSLPDTVMLCDLQFSKDGEGFCLSTLDLENSTTITSLFKDLKPKPHKVNGKTVDGIFGVDFTADVLLEKVFLVQSIYTRTPAFDGTQSLITPGTLLESLQPPPKLWINVEYPSFFNGLKIDAASYITDPGMSLNPAYISSPEVEFLKGLAAQVDKAATKLFLKVTNLDDTEPSTKKPYSELLSDANTIKTFASGVVLPKDSIWPLTTKNVLEPASSLVPDLHKAGLEVFASNFVNDHVLSYNYSFDPTKEYLQFTDNSQFSVDGIITDFPPTASESIACLAQNPNASRVTKTSIITHDGASGDYPGSSDVAYQKAIDDGADMIDCSVQMSKDGVLFCLPSIDLTGTTNAAVSFLDRSTQVTEIQSKNGIFAFDLTWEEIQTLKPQLLSVFDTPLVRNPANKNAGKLVSLTDFLELAKKSALPGVMINIDHAAYLASKGLDIVGTVTTALSNASLDKQDIQKVLIQSEDSSVLSKFQDIRSYHKVLIIDKDISGATKETAQEVKKYADGIRVFRNGIVMDYGSPMYMSSNFSNLLDVMHAENVSVYVGILRNEFENFLFDYYADPYVELATLTQKGVDGLITDFPATASAYMKSPCSDPNSKLPFTILPIDPGSMFTSLELAKPPAAAPPLLQSADIEDPALPPVAKAADSTTTESPPAGPLPESSPAPNKKSASITIPCNTVFTMSAMAVVLTMLARW